MQYRPGKETITVTMRTTLPHATGTAVTAATTPMTGGTTSAQLANAWTLMNRYTSFSLFSLYNKKITSIPGKLIFVPSILGPFFLHLDLKCQKSGIPQDGDTCEDIWKTKKCQRRKNKGKCGKKRVKKNCQKTCGYC